MSKKMKLNLEELKVQSFVTSLKEEEKNNIFGGDEPITAKACKSAEPNPNTCTAL